MSVANKKPFDAGRAAYLTLNGVLLAFLLAPIAIVIVFALNPTPYISFPPVGVSLRWFQKFFAGSDFMNALFLVVPKGETLPVVLFNYMKFDLDGAIAAASMVSILLALSVVVALERLIGLKAYVKL